MEFWGGIIIFFVFALLFAHLLMRLALTKEDRREGGWIVSFLLLLLVVVALVVALCVPFVILFGSIWGLRFVFPQLLSGLSYVDLITFSVLSLIFCFLYELLCEGFVKGFVEYFGLSLGWKLAFDTFVTALVLLGVRSVFFPAAELPFGGAVLLAFVCVCLEQGLEHWWDRRKGKEVHAE